MEDTVNIFKRKYKYAADYALYLAGYIALFFILDFIFPGNIFVGFLSFFGLLTTPIICYRLAVQYRDRAWGGRIRFGQVWSFGVWLFVFTSLLMSVLYYVQCQFLQPDFLTMRFNEALKILETIKAPKEYLDAYTALGVPKPIQYVFEQIWTYTIGGALLFLFISPIVARKKPEEEPQIPNLGNFNEPSQDNNNSIEPKA